MAEQSMAALLSNPDTQLGVYKAFLREAPIALIAIELATKKIAIWNEFATTLFGYSESEAIGQDLSLIIPSEVMGMMQHDKSVNAYAVSDTKAQPKGMGGDRIFWAKTKTGRKIYIEIRVFPLESKSMMLIGAAIEDVSEQQEQLVQLKEQGKQLRKVKLNLELALEETQRLQRDTAEENIDLLEAQSTARQQDRFLIAQVGIVGTAFAFLLFLVGGPMVIEGLTSKRFSASTNNRADHTSDVVGSLLLTLGGAFGASTLISSSSNSRTEGTGKGAIAPLPVPVPSERAIAPKAAPVTPPSFSNTETPLRKRNGGGGEM